jgi:hypothetical protein
MVQVAEAIHQEHGPWSFTLLCDSNARCQHYGERRTHLHDDLRQFADWGIRIQRAGSELE